MNLTGRIRIRRSPSLYKIEENGQNTEVLNANPESWGTFLRYNYLKFNFTSVSQRGTVLCEIRKPAVAAIQNSG